MKREEQIVLSLVEITFTMISFIYHYNSSIYILISDVEDARVTKRMQMNNLDAALASHPCYFQTNFEFFLRTAGSVM